MWLKLHHIKIALHCRKSDFWCGFCDGSSNIRSLYGWKIPRDCLEHLNGSLQVKPRHPPQFIQFCHHPYHLCLWSSSSLLNSLFGTFHSCSASVFVCFERSPGYGWPGAEVLKICWRPLRDFSVKKNSPFLEHLDLVHMSWCWSDKQGQKLDLLKLFYFVPEGI